MIVRDAELARMARSGDATSLGVLLERHRAPLHALALGMLRRREDAQDAVQDAFLIALRKIDQLEEPEAVGGWLRTVVRNVCLSRLRGRWDEVPFAGLVEGSGQKEPFESAAAEAVNRLALREWVWAALLELPETLRITAMLRHFGAFSSYEEISAILGVPMGTVKSRLNQVKVKLAEALLKTAGLSHDEARSISESRTRFFTEAHEEFNRGSYQMLAGSFSDDLLLGYSGGITTRGLEFLVRHVWEENLEAGVKLHPTNILASEDVTVIEGDFENPRADPFQERRRPTFFGA